MKYSTPKIVQTNRRGRYLWALVLFGLGIGIGAGAGWYLGILDRQPVADTNLATLRSEAASQRERIEQLESEKSSLQEQLAVLERASQVDQEATRQVREQLNSFEQERAQLEEELSFLRTMVSTADGKGALQIQRFKLESVGGKGLFRYSFTVTQNMQTDTVASGSIFLAVDGTQEGEARWLPLREITEEKAEKLKMQFKHFQDIEGMIRLPDGFRPRKFIVELKPSNKKLPEVKERFDWVVTG